MSNNPFKLTYTNGKKADPSSFPFHGVQAAPGDSPNKFDMESAGSGAMKGASAGAVLGPWGAVAGGIIGGVAGGISGGKEKKKQELLAKRAKVNLERQVEAEENKQLANFAGGQTQEFAGSLG